MLYFFLGLTTILVLLLVSIAFFEMKLRRMGHPRFYRNAVQTLSIAAISCIIICSVLAFELPQSGNPGASITSTLEAEK